MTQGLASTLTLYDQAGNPVEVALRDGSYVLVVAAPKVEALLSDIVRLLTEANEIHLATLE